MSKFVRVTKAYRYELPGFHKVFKAGWSGRVTEAEFKALSEAGACEGEASKSGFELGEDEQRVEQASGLTSDL